MNLMLLGAGASFGAGPATPCEPPLTASLLEALQKEHPSGWGALPEDLADSFSGDFEGGMIALAKTRPALLAPLQRQMAEFFFRFLPADGNVFLEVARRVGFGWNGAIATLNYDLLLQRSLSERSVSYQMGPGSGIELCLPHGTCNLFCEGVEGVAGEIEWAGMEVATGGMPALVEDGEAFAARIRGDAFPPVMSYFEPDKETTSGVNIILKQRARFATLVEGADRIAVVGVAVRPHDEHIWGPLATAEAEMIYCSGKLAGHEFQEWTRSVGRGKGDTVTESYLAEGLEEVLEFVEVKKEA